MHHSFAQGTDSNTNNAKEQNPPAMSEVRNATVTSNQGATNRSSKTRNDKESYSFTKHSYNFQRCPAAL